LGDIENLKKMIAQNLISEVVPSLLLTDTGQKALNWMEEFRISHLAVVEDKRLVGLLSDQIIYDLNLIDRPVSDYAGHLLPSFVRANQHILEVVKIVSTLKLSAIPVLDSYDQYGGVITIFDLSRKIVDLMAMQEPGGVIVLELMPVDYSLSQIAQIVEGNDAKILGFYISSDIDSTRLEVTLKLNVIDLSAIIQTFVRFDYNIVAVYMDNSVIKDLYGNRFEQLLKYMNV
jgi:acetoin utilization protein AcuB